MKTNKTILVASGSMLAAGMAQGAITYTPVNAATSPGGSVINLDLNSDGTDDFKMFFDGPGTSKPCVQGLSTTAIPTPWVFNEVIMNPNNNGMPVIPFGTLITSQFTVGTNTVSLGVDSEGNHRGYLYQSETHVGQWPTDQDTFGYAALAMVDTTVDPATTNYGWAYLELNYQTITPKLRVIDYAYQDISGSNILAGQRGDISMPAIYTPPTNQTVAVGVTVNMSVVAMADPAPTFQWMAGAIGSGIYTNLPNTGVSSGVYTSQLTIPNVTPANQLDYVVKVSNINGSVTSSPPATLTVIGVGIAGPVPDQQYIYAGYPAQFTVTDIGGVATTNRWRRNGTGLSNGGVYSGADSTNLLIASVNPTNVGNYLAIASTAYGSATSSIAPLSIADPDGSLYESVVRSYGAVNYYRLNETSGTNAWDFIGGRNGIYNSPTASLGNPGPTPSTGFPGFASTNYTAAFQADFNVDTSAYITCLPWNLNADTVTMTAWIYPLVRQGNAGIMFTVGSGNMVCGMRYDGGYENGNGISDGNIGYLWNNDSNAGLWNSGITAPHNQWSLVALAVSPTDATLYIMNADGVQSAVNTLHHDPALFNATEYIGTYPLEAPLGNNNFIGYIDEVAIFKSTLSSNQVAALYGSALNIPPPPNPTINIGTVGGNIQIQWTGSALLQATNVLGPWTTVTPASSPYIVSPTNAQGFFRAQ